MLNKDQFQDQSYVFLKDLIIGLKTAQVEFPPQWHFDHVCYRASSVDNYEILKKAFSTFARCIGEAPVNGRSIATFLLHDPLMIDDHIIRAVELPAPKPGKPFSEGIEHIEIVCDVPLQQLPAHFPQFEWELPIKEKYYNTEIKAVLGNKTLKFHHQSLQTVVTLESHKHVFSTLVASNILEEMKSFSPVVVGTFPLGVHTDQSDVDIILSHSNLQEIRETCLKYYSHLPGFKMHTACLLNLDSLIVHFYWKDVPFELFAQTQPSFVQNGYRHMIVEERLLKVGGDSFFNKVLELRQQGLKTEPAFARAIGLKKGDPFKALLTLWRETDRQLLDRVRQAMSTSL